MSTCIQEMEQTYRVPPGRNAYIGKGGFPMARAATLEQAESDHPSHWPLALARIVIGVLWFTQVLWKLPPDFGCGPDQSKGLCDWIAREIQSPLLPPYAAFLQNIVLPGLGIFGWMTFLLEASIAISLIFGLLSRLGGLLGTLQSLNLLIGLWAVPGEWYWSYIMLTLFCALFMLMAPGRIFGLDAKLRPRFADMAASGSTLGRLGLLAS